MDIQKVVEAAETILHYCEGTPCTKCAFAKTPHCPGSFLYFKEGIGATYSNLESMRITARERVETIKDYAKFHQALSNKN